MGRGASVFTRDDRLFFVNRLGELRNILLALQADQWTLRQAVCRMEMALRRSAAREEQLMATLDETLTLVTQEGTVDDSLIALTQGIKAQLDQLLAGGLTSEQQAKVDQVFAGIQANIEKVSAAVTANTPASPPTP